MKNKPFTIERTLRAPVSVVWSAITSKEQMKQWYFDIKEFKPLVGFEFQFIGKGKDNNKEFLHLCKITEVIPQKKLAYSWRYDGYEGNSLVTFELTPQGDTTKLTLTHEGLHTFPKDSCDFLEENFAEGWTYLIGTSIKEFVEKVNV